jgi:uncharacterized repeat protein (TIGR04052 family)
MSHTHSNTIAFLACAVMACGGGPTSHEILFSAEFQGQPVRCGDSVKPPNAAPWSLTDLRLFIHDLRLVRNDDTEVRFALTPDGHWQNKAVALLDFEDGTGDCLNGTQAQRMKVVGTAPRGEYKALRFTVGVPFSHNHGDPVKATPPLSYTFMHWSWQSGYKFVRMGLQSGDESTFLHLGSTQCQGTFTNIEGCDLENRPTAEIPLRPDAPWRVTLDVDQLTRNVLVQGTADDAPNCMSQVDNPRCNAWFDNMGLNLRTGAARWPSPIFKAP